MNRLAGLDLLRGIAALAVLGYHLDIVFGVLPIFARSYVAVDFFFMLSGFVMARTYEPRFAKLGTLQFMASRTRRLWLPMAVGASIGLGVHLLGGARVERVLPAWVVLLLFLPWPGPRPFFLNIPAWSIFFELFANLAHSTVLKRLTTPVLLAVAAAAFLWLSAYCLGSNLNVGSYGETFLPGFLRVMLSYCIGVALWRWGKPISAPQVLAPTILLSAMLLLPPGLAVDLVFVVAICPVVVLLGASAAGHSLGSTLGELSFPLYAVHFPILEFSKRLGLDPVLGGIAALAVAALLMCSGLTGSKPGRSRR